MVKFDDGTTDFYTPMDIPPPSDNVQPSEKEKTPTGVKSFPKTLNLFSILAPYFPCKECDELGCPYDPDVPSELKQELTAYLTRETLKARIDEAWKMYVNHSPNTTHKEFMKYLNSRTAELQAELDKLS